VFFESPNRLAATLADLAAVAGGGRRACVARELTKLHEEFVRGTLDELGEHFANGARGEITVVVEGADPVAHGEDPVGALDDDALDEAIAELAETGSRAREIAAELAARTGLPRRELYARAAAFLGGRSRTAPGSDEV
jgi:16S rRNA (cytidine1402-2'-O)-methyltransferase